MKQLDNDGSGLIDYSEFLAATMSRKVYLQYDYLWQVFKQFDSSRTGKITKDDLSLVLSGGKDKKYVAGKTSVMKDIDDIMMRYDTDKSGDIDFDEFMELMRGKAEDSQQSNLGQAAPIKILKEKADKKDKGLLGIPDSTNESDKRNLGTIPEGQTVTIGPDGMPNRDPLFDEPRNVGCCGFF
jgi:hypothetical protein